MQEFEGALRAARPAAGNANWKSAMGILALVLMVGAIGYLSIYKSYLGEVKLGTAEAFMLMLLALAVGDFVSVKTKAMIPYLCHGRAVHRRLLDHLSAEHSGIGRDCSQPAGLFRHGHGHPPGTMLNKDELVAQWRTVLVTIAVWPGSFWP